MTFNICRLIFLPFYHLSCCDKLKDIYGFMFYLKVLFDVQKLIKYFETFQLLYEKEGLNVKKIHYVDNQDCIGRFAF